MNLPIFIWWDLHLRTCDLLETCADFSRLSQVNVHLLLLSAVCFNIAWDQCLKFHLVLLMLLVGWQEGHPACKNHPKQYVRQTEEENAGNRLTQVVCFMWYHIHCLLHALAADNAKWVCYLLLATMAAWCASCKVAVWCTLLTCSSDGLGR